MAPPPPPPPNAPGGAAVAAAAAAAAAASEGAVAALAALLAHNDAVLRVAWPADTQPTLQQVGYRARRLECAAAFWVPRGQFCIIM